MWTYTGGPLRIVTDDEIKRGSYRLLSLLKDSQERVLKSKFRQSCCDHKVVRKPKW